MRIFTKMLRRVLTFICLLPLIPGESLMCLRSGFPVQAEQAVARIPDAELDSLVAPVALYPDPLLAQTLVASTYPLEVIQLHQWMQQNKGLKDKALAEAVQKQKWDASIQAMAAFPDVVNRLSENIKWTTDLGNAFLAQQNDVMNAVQRMRAKAQESGNLKSNEQQKVETKVVESKSVIVIQQASPEVVYVPSYNPTVVYGAAVYPYPVVAYPPPGYYAAGMALSFGVGVAMGAAWGGGWGWHSGWGGNNDITVNRNNTFVNNSQRTAANRQTANRGGNTWQHNPQHRGGAPYANRETANRYGGTARGDSAANRQANARSGGARTQPTSMSARSTSAGANRSATSGSGGDRAANRSASQSSRDSGAFGDRNMSGSSARASSQRGASSMSSSRSSGGVSRGGGGSRGGGRRR